MYELTYKISEANYPKYSIVPAVMVQHDSMTEEIEEYNLVYRF